MHEVIDLKLVIDYPVCSRYRLQQLQSLLRIEFLKYFSLVQSLAKFAATSSCAGFFLPHADLALRQWNLNASFAESFEQGTVYFTRRR